MELKKKYVHKILTASVVALLGCSTVTDNHQPLQIDVKLVGIWTGEHEEQDGSTRSWIQERKADGTYSIDFIFMERDGMIERLTETGRWWVEGGLFHEIESPTMKGPDSYQYQFKNNGCIEFLLVASEDSDEDIGQYRFAECLSADASMSALKSLELIYVPGA